MADLHILAVDETWWWGQTVKDLYEELRMLEMKVSRPNSSVRSTDIMIPKQQEESLSSKVQPPQTSSYSKSSSDRYKNDNKRTNPNLPPLAGFDEKDLNLYVPIAEDVNKMAPNMTLNERIGLFRDAPELQAHFKEKIQNLLLGPLEEMQELENIIDINFPFNSKFLGIMDFSNVPVKLNQQKT